MSRFRVPMPTNADDRDRLLAEGWSMGCTLDGFLYAEPPKKLGELMGHQAYIDGIRKDALTEAVSRVKKLRKRRGAKLHDVDAVWVAVLDALRGK